MKQVFLLFTIIFFFIFSSLAQKNDKALILKVLSNQQSAWNNGDIETYMKGYWQNDSLMFIGKSGITYGWQQTLNNYKKNYPDTAAMGKLNFDFIEIKRLSVNYFFVVGKWHLARTIGNLNGVFTLLFRKIKNKWVIIKDHSS